MDTFVHPADLPIILSIAAGALVPEFIQGFEEQKTLARLAILTGFCTLAALFAFYLQHTPPGVAFTQAFLIGITTRISLLMNHTAHATIPLLRDLLRELRAHNQLAHKSPTTRRTPHHDL